ncbi:MAG: proton-coupled thiamine transporter YuaJ [Ruminococcaceae bacterium]|nr:proton-coupled thiamine transporter YuaJ [Oscillospiraceae bacterium]
MKEKTKISANKLTLSAIFIALATVLSLIKIIKMPLGGSVTLFSMLPIVMISCMLGVKWGMAVSFVYSLIQLALGIALDGLLGWGLTPVMLIGTITLDYVLAFSVLGIAGVFAKKGNGGICFGVISALVLRFICHLISGCVIFKELEQFEIFGEIFVNRPFLYSLSYNAFYMLPEIIITVIGAVILFNLPQIKKIVKV